MSPRPAAFRSSLRRTALALLPTVAVLAACDAARASADKRASPEAVAGADAMKKQDVERCPVRPVAPAGLGPVMATASATDSAAADSAVSRDSLPSSGMATATQAVATSAAATGTATMGASAGTSATMGAKPAAPAKPTAADSAKAALRARWTRVATAALAARLPGAIFPGCRVVAYYGNPLSKRMGVLGEYPKDEMLAKLDKEVAHWQRADSSVKVIPALHYIVTVAQGSAGRDNTWRMRMPDSLVERMATWAQEHDALLFLDVQVGQSTLKAELPRLVPFLKRPNVHLGIDPEFSMKDGTPPGKKIGTYDAADVNYAIGLLADVVKANGLPPKVLVVHRFTRKMVTNVAEIRPDPRVQVVMDMDGWGGRVLKLDSYRAYVQKEPVQYTGFKLFYHNDQKKAGTQMMTPEDVLASLEPKPLYIQYQ